MSLNQVKSIATKRQPEQVEPDIENCHENIQDLRYERIAERAYFMAEARGFAPGYELDDWLAAEREVRWY